MLVMISNSGSEAEASAHGATFRMLRNLPKDPYCSQKVPNPSIHTASVPSFFHIVDTVTTAFQWFRIDCVTV